MKIRTLTLAVFLAVLAVPLAARAELVLEKQSGDPERELWTKLDRLSEVKSMIQDGEYDQARILLDAVASNFPDAREVKEFYKMLDDASASKPRAGRDNVTLAEKTNAMWVKYNGLKTKGDYAAARNTLLKIREVYSDGSMPEFLSGFDKEFADTERALEAGMAGRIGNFGARIAAAAMVSGAEERLSAYVSIFGEVQELLAGNTGFAPAADLHKRLSAKIEKAARIVHAKLAAVRDLEGCEAATPGFGRLLENIRYPEIEYYQRVKDEMELCER